jgi:hypothetical protein
VTPVDILKGACKRKIFFQDKTRQDKARQDRTKQGKTITIARQSQDQTITRQTRLSQGMATQLNT